MDKGVTSVMPGQRSDSESQMEKQEKLTTRKSKNQERPKQSQEKQSQKGKTTARVIPAFLSGFVFLTLSFS
jgi:hypothetical protein